MTSETDYERLATRFIQDQTAVLGPQAQKLAESVDGVSVETDNSVTIHGDGQQTIARLAEEFREMFGANVEQSFLSAAHDLDRAIELPPSLGFDRELQGYTEYKKDGTWNSASEIADVDPQPEVWTKLFGFGTVDTPASEFDRIPIAKERGIPMDASEAVHEEWIEQKRAENGVKKATGHTWITAAEIPDSLLETAADDLVEVLIAARDRFGPEQARLIVWLGIISDS